MTHEEFWNLTPQQFEERHHAAIESRKQLFGIIQTAVAHGMAGEWKDPEELFEERDPTEPEWKSEVAKLDAVLPDTDKE